MSYRCTLYASVVNFSGTFCSIQNVTAYYSDSDPRDLFDCTFKNYCFAAE